jgi:hypothetical protein
MCIAGFKSGEPPLSKATLLNFLCLTSLARSDYVGTFPIRFGEVGLSSVNNFVAFFLGVRGVRLGISEGIGFTSYKNVGAA